LLLARNGFSATTRFSTPLFNRDCLQKAPATHSKDKERRNKQPTHPDQISQTSDTRTYIAYHQTSCLARIPPQQCARHCALLFTRLGSVDSRLSLHDGYLGGNSVVGLSNLRVAALLRTATILTVSATAKDLAS